MKTHRGNHSENHNRRAGLIRKTGPTRRSGRARQPRRSRLVPVYIVLAAAMILLCRPVAVTAGDGEGQSRQRVVTDKSAGMVEIPIGMTALNGLPRIQSVASPKRSSVVPTDPQAASGSTGRARGCPDTNLGVLLSSGGSWTGSTTGSTDDFDASLLGCADVTGGRDEIFQFIVDADGIWKFDTCTVAAGWDTSLSLHEGIDGRCPGDFLACDGDGCNVVYFESALAASLTSGTTYYVIVDGGDSTQFGDFTVTYEYIGPVPRGCPGTDLGVLNSAGGSWTGSTIGSTDDFDDRFGTECQFPPGGHDEVFQFTVDVAGEWKFDTCAVPACWNTNLTIRKETGGGCPGDFAACDADGCDVCYYESSLETFLSGNTTYYLVIDGYSSFAYGDFEITYVNVVPGCFADTQCDDGIFCNGAERCDTTSGLCLLGVPPCQAPADCDEVAETCNIDPCITWRAGRGSTSFLPQGNICPNTKTWVFDDIQVTHLRGDVLGSYTTPLVSSAGVLGASPNGTTFFVDQAIWTVETMTCNPLAIIPGTQCAPSGAVGADGLGVEPFRCTGTAPVLPDNNGDFDRCEVDFFIAYRTAENGAGMWVAGEDEFIGGPAAADDFGKSVIWLEGCPPDGIYVPWNFAEPDSRPADFATAEVCQNPALCSMADLTRVIFADSDPIAPLAFDQPGHCAIDAREPHAIADGTARNGWDRMVMSFPCNPTALRLSSGDFSVSTTPPNGAVGIGSVNVDAVANTVTVMLTGEISPGVWTCISHPASGGQWCMGYLPADASQDGLSSASDIGVLINAINAVPGFELPLYAADIDRSGRMNGQDILRLIDLLNGADEFAPWIAAGLPPCP